MASGLRLPPSGPTSLPPSASKTRLVAPASFKITPRLLLLPAAATSPPSPPPSISSPPMTSLVVARHIYIFFISFLLLSPNALPNFLSLHIYDVLKLKN
ncbi:hypothetical protein Patl1_11052 [Pistacia atlantica]|uniref:Uncharacterized protein n=1 Tax=Pistacia atlantica TaxID=434234 RepID=A0ACC1A6V0_9ROSI|nr:hypothetical protein Patl1_11052 [Pistacia atlantica]